MIENTIKRANENTLLKTMNTKIKTKEKNLEWNKKRYWKLLASERLHYDSRAEKIKENTSTHLFYITLLIAFGYFLVLVIFTLFKVLFQVDPTLLVNAFLNILGTAPLAFKISVFADILILVLGIRSKRKYMKLLNENYGFKKV